MYLSRIQLNRYRRDARWLLASPQRLHAAVLQSFLDPPTGGTGDGGRVLWRLDNDADRLFLYVVSPDRPDFAHLAEQAGWPTADRGQSKDYTPLLDRLESGQTWAFRLTANPTQYKALTPDRPMKRVAHVTAGYQSEWLVAKAHASGFRLTETSTGEDPPVVTTDLRVTSRATHSFDRRGTRGQVTIATAQFDGRLEVTDAAQLRRALVTGIGPAKAYGCGLMTLAAVS